MLMLWFMGALAFGIAPLLVVGVWEGVGWWEHRSHSLDDDGSCLRCLERRVKASERRRSDDAAANGWERLGGEA